MYVHTLQVRKVFFVLREVREMKSKELPRQKTVFSITPEEWDARVNAALDELEGYESLNIHREKTQDGFLAVIEYTVRQYIPEDIREELQLKGVHYRCNECEYLMRVPDKRVKHLECEKGMRDLTRADMDACMWRYEQDIRGLLK